MTVTARGFRADPAVPGDAQYAIDDADWSFLHEWSAAAYRGQVVPAGLAPTAAGTRGVTISAAPDGFLMPGLVVRSTEPVSVTHDAQASGTRVDYVVAEADWSARTVTIKVVKGPLQPTQNRGVLWQMPLARVTVRSTTTGVIPAADVVPCKPLPPEQMLPKVASVTAKSWWATTVPGVVATVTLPDPGRPYLVDADATVMISGDSGRANGWLNVNGAWIRMHRTGILTTTNGDVPLTVLGVTAAPLTGPSTVTFTVGPSGVAQGQQIHAVANDIGRLHVRQIPV